MSKQTIQVAITDTIYQSLFGLTRDDVIREAKKRAGVKWNYMNWDNDDEAAKDCMSIEALQALNTVQSDILRILEKSQGIQSVKQIRSIAKHVATPYKVTNIWDD